jgi:hypothetical protein
VWNNDGDGWLITVLSILVHNCAACVRVRVNNGSQMATYGRFCAVDLVINWQVCVRVRACGTTDADLRSTGHSRAVDPELNNLRACVCVRVWGQP